MLPRQVCCLIYVTPTSPLGKGGFCREVICQMQGLSAKPAPTENMWVWEFIKFHG